MASAKSAIDRIEHLIQVSSQRILPQALHRLSVAQILRDWSIKQIQLPTLEQHHLTGDLETGYNRILKFIRGHHPSGHEADVAHKRDVVRYLALNEMLQECQNAKLPHIITTCLEKVIIWFDSTSEPFSASPSILPTRMSPKKTMHDANVEANTIAKLAPGGVDHMARAQLSEKLEKYKVPNLRASHIRRVAQLKTQGADVPEEQQLVAVDEQRSENINHIAQELSKAEQNKRIQHAKIDATFQSYQPETDAEYIMNQMWLERQEEESLESKKSEAVREKLRSWSTNKARDASEYLRKHEAMQLAAGLDRYCHNKYEPNTNSRRQQLEKRDDWHTLQKTPIHQPSPVLGSNHDDSKEASTGEKYILAKSISHPILVKTPSKKMSTNQSPGTQDKGSGSLTSGGSGGMHFRNQLPPHFNPKSRRSNGSGSGEGTPNSKDRSPPSSSSLSAKLDLLDESTLKSMADGILKKGGMDLTPSSQDSPMTADEEDREVFGKFSDQNGHSTNQHFNFQPFYPTIQENRGKPAATTTPEINSVLYRKLFPRGTIAPQSEPQDPEYRQLHVAAQSRKPPLPPTLPEKFLNKYASTSKLTALRANNRATRPSSAGVVMIGSDGMSELRAQQMHEVERIRVLFERHNVQCSTESLECGLVVPEDRQTIDCIQNLPLPGCRLIRNPLLQLKVKTSKVTKKKKGKSKGKGGKKKKVKSGSSPKKKK